MSWMASILFFLNIRLQSYTKLQFTFNLLLSLMLLTLAYSEIIFFCEFSLQKDDTEASDNEGEDMSLLKYAKQDHQLL